MKHQDKLRPDGSSDVGGHGRRNRGEDTVKKTVRAAARSSKPLDGADAQALEGALQQVEREQSALLDELGALREMAGNIAVGLAADLDMWKEIGGLLAALGAYGDEPPDWYEKEMEWEADSERRFGAAMAEQQKGLRER